MMQYYPLAPGNKWEYKAKDGSLYTNSVVSVNGPIVTMKNSTVPDNTQVKVVNGIMYNELLAKDNYQLWLKDDLKKGETWDATFTANGLNSIMAFTVKETGITKEVDGKTYHDVIMLESESKINMNGNLISTQFFTQYYYAKSVGLIMTTSSMGDMHTLQNYVLN
jgi:hypothetical protein